MRGWVSAPEHPAARGPEGGEAQPQDSNNLKQFHVGLHFLASIPRIVFESVNSTQGEAMTYPATQPTLHEAFQQAHGLVREIRKRAINNRDALAAGNQAGEFILRILLRARQDIATLQSVSAIPGIGAYAQSQMVDETLNIGTEFSAVLAALGNVESWLETNLPRDNGHLLLINADGTDVEFTPAQTAGLRTQLQALIDTMS